MKHFRILIFLVLALASCQGGKNWKWTVDGLSKDYRTDDFNDHVCVRFYPNKREWQFWSGQQYGPYYYGQAVGVNSEQTKTRFGRYEFPGRFHIYISENYPKSFSGSYSDEWAELVYVDWIDEENIRIAYRIYGATKTCRLSGGIEKK